ncbi:MAG: hypothetical protein K9L82_10610 [Chromatiaceae bacterium]|nr:hypothetical protein [Chromatiaceae bacterium]MCF7993531.1 hypothetical protein [Chromatiaceae bacterium]MCF8005098.1 hypothetical protein [Chromatiaceae bacterium]MCF8014534.1 hypothetical protein [Chromatiaceae bacterium]
MADSFLWTRQGETLSHKNACKEFGLTEEEIFDAIRQGKIEYKENYAHGNPYFKLLRAEVKSLVLELRGVNYLKEKEVEFQLRKVTSKINSLKRKISYLEKEKAKIIEEYQRFKDKQ